MNLCQTGTLLHEWQIGGSLWKGFIFFMDQESNMATTAKQSLQIKGHHKKVFSVWFLKFKIWNEEVFSCLLFNQEGIFEMKKYFHVC